MRSPRPSLLLTLALVPTALSVSACKTIYSDMYSYKKNYFDARESREFDNRQLEEAKKQAEVARATAERAAKSEADKIGGGAGALQLDSGLGGGLGGMSGMGAGSAIPGLGASPGGAAPAMSGIPGLDAAPSMTPGMAPSMTPGMAPAMSGGEAMGGAGMTPPKPAATLPGL
jgi:hypothetical protein